MDNKMVFVFLLFMVAIVQNAFTQSTANADEENHVGPTDPLTTVTGDDGGQQPGAEGADVPVQDEQPTAAVTAAETTATAKGDRSGRQLYQPFAYQPLQPLVFPQRRAYRGPKKRPSRTKSGRRPRPRRRRPSGPPSAGRYRRLPGPVRAQQVNYIDAASADYYDDDIGVGVGGVGAFEYGPQQPAAAVGGPYADYLEQRELDRDPTAYAVMSSPLTSGRSRKRPAVGGYVDDAAQLVHVPMLRVIRPAAVAVTTPAAATTTTTTTAAVDTMEKLRQLVHEAMDAHFAGRHQDLYSADGTFDNKLQRQHVYSAKYKRQDRDKAADRDKVDAAPAKSKDHAVQYVSYATQPPPAATAADVDADGSDDRLTLAEISAYMGAKPAETVLSAGGHRYVLSDALQHSYRQQQQQQQQQQEQQQLQLQYGGDGHHNQYLRYVSPFEAMYELPAARWAYK